jgi:8-oxo-dGTP diphosphatase
MPKIPQVILKSRYRMVPRTLILLFNEEKVLLQKGSETKKIYAGFYNGLGGHVERGEDVKSCARREIKEEAGIECDDLFFCGTIAIDVKQDQGILLFVFSGSHIIGEIIKSDEGEVEWIPICEIAGLPVVEDIPELIERVKLTKRGKIPFHLLYSYEENGIRVTISG